MPHPTELIKSSLQREPGAALQSLFDQERVDLGVVNPERSEKNHVDPDGAVSRVLAAAIINRKFCHLLLTNPTIALTVGYRGESFGLSTAEKELLLQIHATSIREFAHLLLIEIQKHNQ